MSQVNFIPGLMSVTFRSLPSEEIIKLAAKAQLKAIGWSADVHVPADDLSKVQAIGKATRAAGLEVASYCSYFRLGEEGGLTGFEDEAQDFNAICAAANALGAPSIRVWAGRKGSKETNNSEFNAIAQDGKRIADIAKAHDLEITLEYHSGTLTDSAASAMKLHDFIAKRNVKLDWQPPNHMNFEQRCASLEAVVNRLANFHVFHWMQNGAGKIERLPLRQGAEDWQRYFEIAQSKCNDDKKHYALLEFVSGETEEQFFEDAKAFRKILAI